MTYPCHLIDPETRYVQLDAKHAFEQLSPREQQYAHHLSRASWYGGLAGMVQTSCESVLLFLLLQRVFRDYSIDELNGLSDRLSSSNNNSNNSTAFHGITRDQMTAFFTYVGAFYGNLGNYKSFGDSKFIPDLPMDSFAAILKRTAKAWDDDCDKYWTLCKEKIYSLTNREQQLGFGPTNGISTYYSANCTESDAQIVQAFLDEKNFLACNSRLFKRGERSYEVRLASSLTHDVLDDSTKTDLHGLIGDHDIQLASEEQPVHIRVTRGDYAALLQACIENLQLAKTVAANDREIAMLDDYIVSFTTGSMRAHQTGSEHWVKNAQPAVETYLGFIETYRDPYGSRADFEGLVAIVNKKMSAKYAHLVACSMDLLTLLPIDSAYHKDKFLQPDYTSLQVLTFASNGIPVGINIPNYDYIRQSIGFKNVSLHNVLAARTETEDVPFIEDAYQKLYKDTMTESFEIQVALHELLGHGSGKLFMMATAESPNTPNFAAHGLDAQINKFTQRPASETAYRLGETYDSKFSSISNAYEECRAETIGVYLSLFPEVLRALGHDQLVAHHNLTYINWLNMVRSGLTALEFYTPETQSFRQSHCEARFAIFRVLLEHGGPDLLRIDRITSARDGRPDLVVHLDEKQIYSTGKRVLGEFLEHIQVFKTTGDDQSARKYFKALTVLDTDDLLQLRETVIDRRRPRPLFIQANTRLAENCAVTHIDYPQTPQGMIMSYLDRFPDTQELQYRLEDAVLEDLRQGIYAY